MRTATLQRNLDKACKHVSKALSKRGTLPATTQIKLETHEGMLYLTTTDLEMAVTVGIGAMNEEDGAVCVGGKLFSQLVTKAPKDSRFDLYTTDHVLMVKNGSSEMSLSAMDADEFPPIPDKFVPYLTIYPDTLQDAIDSTAYCVADEDTRPVLQAVLLEPKNNTLTVAAADGFRLAVYKAACENVSEIPVLVRGEHLDKISTFLKGVKEPVSVFVNAKTHQPTRYDKMLKDYVPDGEPYTEAVQIAFAWDDTTVVCQCVSGKFPDYRQLIPTSYDTAVTFDRDAMKNAVALVKPIAQDGSGIVRLELVCESLLCGKIILSARSEQIGDTRQQIDCHIEGESKRIAFNVKYLHELIKNVGPLVRLEVTTPSSPGVFIDGEYVQIIMPMFVEWGTPDKYEDAWHDLSTYYGISDMADPDPPTEMADVADETEALDAETIYEGNCPTCGQEVCSMCGGCKNEECHSCNCPEFAHVSEDMSCDDCGYNPTHGGLCEQVGDTECRAYYDYNLEGTRDSCPNCDRENLATGYVEAWDGVCPDCGRKIPMCETCFFNPEFGGVCVYDPELHNFDCPAWQEYIPPDKQMIETGATILIGGSE